VSATAQTRTEADTAQRPREIQLERLGKAFRDVFRSLSRLRGRDTHLGGAEISHAQFELLIELKEKGELPAGELAAAARKHGVVARAHLKVDTGMARLGSGCWSRWLWPVGCAQVLGAVRWCSRRRMSSMSCSHRSIAARRCVDWLSAGCGAQLSSAWWLG